MISYRFQSADLKHPLAVLGKMDKHSESCELGGIDTRDVGEVGSLEDGVHGLHRKLGPRRLQLITIGGAIGTALFIAIGSGLYQGGPGSLFLAFLIECAMVGMLNNCLAEMVTYMPVSGGFVSLAGKWVDDAWGFMAGWNFFIYLVLAVPYEISAINLLLSYWRDDIPVLAICLVCIALYAYGPVLPSMWILTKQILCYSILNIFAVESYGEAEFWLASGKVLLIILLFFFTFITMVGGNPKHDAYGFRYWNDPGAFATYRTTGDLGRFEGFLGALWMAAFTVTGPEYISMVAAEAKHPRLYIKNAYKTMYWRFGTFFIGGSLCVGVVIAYNDPSLVGAITNGNSSAAASLYIIAMKNLGIKGLPDFCSALMVTSVFSAGNNYTYTATRALYGMAINGRAPRFFAYTTKRGVPIYCLSVPLAFAFLSLLQLSGGSYKVLGWLVSITTANIMIYFITIMVTYVCFYRACRAQGFDRKSLPYTGRFQPYCGYIALMWFIVVVFCFGYSSFKPWNTTNFFLNYVMLIFCPSIFFIWKYYKKTRWLRPEEVDLKWEADAITAYEASVLERPTTFWRDMFAFLNIRKRKARASTA
ncbi:General amino acid permease AGP2 [Exophiala dermatitidis]